VGTTQKGSNDKNTGQWPSALSSVTHDGTTAGDDLWGIGTDIAPAEYRDDSTSGFGIQIQANVGAGDQAAIDAVTADLTYRIKPMHWSHGAYTGAKGHWY
jgi:hypothetical protein